MNMNIMMNMKCIKLNVQKFTIFPSLPWNHVDLYAIGWSHGNTKGHFQGHLKFQNDIDFRMTINKNKRLRTSPAIRDTTRQPVEIRN